MFRPYRKDRWRTRLVFGLGLVISGILIVFAQTNLNLWFGGFFMLGGLLTLVRAPWERTRSPGPAFVRERKRFKLMERKARIVVIEVGPASARFCAG